jgi:hypothetical protein
VGKKQQSPKRKQGPEGPCFCAPEKRASPISSWLSLSASQFDPVIFFLEADVTPNNLWRHPESTNLGKIVAFF